MTDEVKVITEALERMASDNAELRESLDEVRMSLAFEDAGWTLLGNLASGEHLEGLDLDELKEISEKIRPHVVADSLVKRGADLHAGYVWSKGMNIAGVARSGGAGAPSGLVKFYEDVVNQESLFSALAHEELQKSRYADGNVILACDTSKKQVRRIPLNQITAIRTNPDFPEEIWAYQRTWDPQTGEPEKKVRWYLTNRWPQGKRKPKSFTDAGKTVPVEPDTVIVDKKFNRQVGYPLGIPDAVAAMPWSAAYTEVIQYGRVVNESLAKILYKVVSKTREGAKTTGVKMSTFSGHGNTASMVEGQDIQAISTAGKGYDFTSARPVASMAASALNVSVVELLSDSSAAGSSYGAAQTLSPSTKNAMRLMQSEWVELYYEVFRVFNLRPDRIWFENLDEADPYRAAQQLVLLAPTLNDEEYRSAALDLLNIPGDAKDIPDLLSQRNQTPEPVGASAGVQAASPDQGQSNGTGGGGSTAANDLRTDTQSESLLVSMQSESILERLESLIARAEAAGL